MRKIKIECLHEFFETHADFRPHKQALICGAESMTYQELEHRANQLSHCLRSHGVGPGTLVGLYFERSAKPIIALLAVLKAGAGYVPIDPNYPMERVRHILTETEVVVLLTEGMLSEQASSFFIGTTLLIDAQSEEIARHPVYRLSRGETGVSPRDLCYIIYTSGTTGRPKGIMTEHRNVIRFVFAFNKICRVNSSDRVYQGFSLGFDGSVEEIWMAFSNGATLVVGTPDVVRFGNEVARLFNEKKVTFFSTVPTFLSMINEDLPTVRLLVVSGEQCPAELVAKWAQTGRRMLNVYGPTETTVNATAWECAVDKPVTIGRPLPGYKVYILDERLNPVPPSKPGELYIGGVGVARGYLNQPGLTEKHFVANPFDGTGPSLRLYRTGDRVRMTDDGQLQFMGRIDSQVKIRGFRIELSEIESVLREHPTVHEAVVNVFQRDGLQELSAYVVPESGDGSLDRDDVLDLLRKRLPAYMVPGYLDLIEELPTLPSGKIDRKRLPKPSMPLVRTEREIVAPSTELERKIADIWEKVFKISPVSIEDNFFLDLGGYSLLAAQVVSLLRNEKQPDVAIRDVYRYPTIKQLAAHLASSLEEDAPQTAPEKERTGRQTSRQVFESLPRFARHCCIGLQAISLFLIYGLAAAPLVILFGLVFSAIRGTMGFEPAVWLVFTITLGAYPTMLLMSIVFKWLIIGRFKPGKYPLWGFYYFRWWLVTRIQALSGIGILAGTPVMSLYYRLMGASVGRNCIIDTSLCAIYDLVKIGDDTCICAETQILGYRIEDGMLILGTIEIGSRCFVGIHSTLGLNTRMCDDARLDDLSLLPDSEVMPAGESRRGSPAQPAKVDLPEITDAQATHRHPLVFGMIHIILVEVLAIIMFITVLPSLVIVTFPLLLGGIRWAMVSAFIAVPVHVIWFCLSVAAVKALILGRLEPGVYPVESLLYLRKWLVDVLLSISRTYLHPLYTTIYVPPWLRLLGAKIGARAEISTVSQITPDLIIIEGESFFADGAIIGGRHFFRGHAEFAVNRIGRRSFVGNNAILPLGSNLGDNCLLGVLSAPPAGCKQTPDGSEWLGAPAFELPHRQKVGGFEESVTYEPTVKLYIQRYIIDALRILIPYFMVAAGSIAFFFFLALASHLPVWVTLVFTPPIAFGIAIGVALSVVALKNLLMAPFKPVIKPLWSPYIWWNEVINGAYETIGAPALAPLMGTPLFNWYLRLMGCKIGKHVFLETGLLSEFDLVDIGDYVALNLGVVVQNHLFEDRIMKSSYLRIGDECSVGNMSVVLYDTEMQRGSSIGPLSLLMKGETLPPFTRWLGIPTSRS